MSGSAGDLHTGVLRDMSDDTQIPWAKSGRVAELSSQCFGGLFAFGSCGGPGIGDESVSKVPGRIFLTESEMGGTIISRVGGIEVDTWVGSEASF